MTNIETLVQTLWNKAKEQHYYDENEWKTLVSYVKEVETRDSRIEELEGCGT